jgi:hypothetical protein
MDYVATNFGLNTKYHASHAKPTRLYVSDFDSDGRLDLVEAKFEGEKCFPIRGRSCSSRSMPFIQGKFETYHDFAIAGLEDIYSKNSLESADRFEVTRLESVVLINDGHAKFQVRALPRMAQASPGFGLVLTDFDADGRCDVAMVQNFMHPQPETGQMDGGLGLLLAGDGRGGFKPIEPSRSGLVVTGQGMGMATVDIDEDGRPDLAIATNDGPAILLRNQGALGTRPLAVRLEGLPGNPVGVGARVTVISKSGAKRAGEVHAGSGYLSQSSPELFFGAARNDPPERIEVRWPTGETSTHPVEAGKVRLVLRQLSRLK